MTEREQLKQSYLESLMGKALPRIYDIGGFTPNGCGPMIKGGGWLARWIAWIVPDHFWGMGIPEYALEAIGDWHDFLYWWGGTARARRVADVYLYYLILESSKGHSRLTQCRLKKIARVYFSAVRLAGGLFFNYRRGTTHEW